MDQMGKYLENYRCLDGCQKLNTLTKAVKVMLLSDALIIQLNISKYIDSIIKKFILNLNIDEQISIRGNRVRENNSIAGIIHRELKLIKFGF